MGDRLEIAPRAADATVHLARLAPDGSRVAFVESRPGVTSLCIAPLSPGAPDTPTFATKLGAIKPLRLVWSPTGSHVLVVAGSIDPLDPAPTCFVVRADRYNRPHAPDGLVVEGTFRAANAVWHPNGLFLLATMHQDAAATLSAVGMDGTTTDLIAIDDDGGIAMPPRIACRNDGHVVAFTTRRIEGDVSGVWIVDVDAVTQSAPRPPRLVTQVPGADATITPFWRAQGSVLGLGIVHPSHSKSAIVLIGDSNADGEIVHESPLLDPPHTPAWSADGHALYFLRRDPEGALNLVELDPESRTMRGICEVPPSAQDPHVLSDGRVVVESEQAVLVLTFQAKSVHLPGSGT